MICVTENIDVIWKNIDKVRVINHLIFIIQRSNMKRPLSLSVEVLKRFGSKMNENESDRDYKIRFLDDMLKFLYRSASKSDSTIRRSPDSRLVIHAMCISDTNPNKVGNNFNGQCLLANIKIFFCQKSNKSSNFYMFYCAVKGKFY